MENEDLKKDETEEIQIEPIDIDETIELKPQEIDMGEPIEPVEEESEILETEELEEEPVEEKVEEKKEEETETPIEEKKEVQEGVKLEEVKDSEEEAPKSKKGKVIIIIILLLLICGGVAYYLMNGDTKSKGVSSDVKKSPYRLSGNSLENFDLYFLKLENSEKNKIYSPLSIKYALEMLSEGANGTSKKQIDNILGTYTNNKYTNSDNMSFANAMFIRNTFQESIKKSYTNNLKDKYGAEVKIDKFKSPDNINSWVSEKTFKLINNLVDEKAVKEADFFLINALAIDMNWKNQIECTYGHKIPCVNDGNYHVYYNHEKIDDNAQSAYSRNKTQISDDEFSSIDFNGTKGIKAGNIIADFNRYDILKEVGEQKIRETVSAEYEKWLQGDEAKLAKENGYEITPTDKYVDKYIQEIGSNNGKSANSTDFMLYEDNSVKAFAKDLQEYNGTTLQYVGIMPKEKELTKYIEDTKAADLNKVINNLKTMDIENFKEGVATIITGDIPFFKYDYELKLMEDLKKLGVKDVFQKGKADLSNMTDVQETYINEAVHKATIEFSNDGIKAAAASSVGGAGATSGGFEYLYKIPVEKIDITFNKPYLYLIRDKKTGEVWFTGTVYEPIKK